MNIKKTYLALTLLSILASFKVISAEINDGELAPTSTGSISITLKVGESVSAGFLQTNLDNPNSDFQHLLTHRLIKGIQRNTSTTLPLCIYSSEGGYFEVSSYELAGNDGNFLQSQFGATVPVDISIGTEDRTRFQGVSENCDLNSTIPVTIHLNQALNGDEIGRINGKFNLLVKTE